MCGSSGRMLKFSLRMPARTYCLCDNAIPGCKQTWLIMKNVQALPRKCSLTAAGHFGFRMLCNQWSMPHSGHSVGMKLATLATGQANPHRPHPVSKSPASQTSSAAAAAAHCMLSALRNVISRFAQSSRTCTFPYPALCRITSLP